MKKPNAPSNGASANSTSGGLMTINKSRSIIAGALLLLTCGTAYGDSAPSYDATVKLIRETMANSPSVERKESYGAISFGGCTLQFTVSGTYPVGELYTMKNSGIDFSSLNAQGSSVGHDYTPFIALNFRNSFHSKGDFRDIAIRTLVVNVSSDEKAQLLFQAFLRMGELCGAQEDAR
jgi:hypothetical protein